MSGMTMRTSRRATMRGRIRPLQTVEFRLDLFSTVWKRRAHCQRDSRSGTMMSESRNDAYGYNERNELISASKLGGPGFVPAAEYAYQYDNIGNRITSTELDAGGPTFVSASYAANNLNQYTSISNSALSASPREAFTPQFDDDGNQTLVQTSTYIWQVQYNGENRPVEWSNGTTNITMKFDRMGRRVEYIETVDNATNTHHRFVYDGYLCIQRLNAAANNAIDLIFAWDPAEPVATRPLMIEKPGVCTLHVMHDGNKNVSDLVFFNGGSGVAAHYEYAPFGALTVSTRNSTSTAYDFRTYNPFRFSSEYADDALGLVYYNYRHYGPVMGRWLSRDPIGGVFEMSFIINAQVMKNDILGLKVWSDRKSGGCSFADIDNEAKKALKEAIRMMNSNSPREEWFGCVCCKCEDGKYVTSHTPPQKGKTKGEWVDLPNGMRVWQEQKVARVTDAKCGTGETLVGYYHTHPDGRNLSSEDKRFVKGRDVPLYLAKDEREVQMAEPMRTDEFGRLSSTGDNAYIPDGWPTEPKVTILPME